MTIYSFFPGVGVGPIRLGMAREQVRGAMRSSPESFVRDKTHIDAFDSIQVNYSARGIADFIEVAQCSNLHMMFDELNLLSLSMRDLVKLFSTRDRYTIKEGTTYSFDSLRVALWRNIPYDAKLSGSPESISTWAAGYWA